MMGLGAHIGDGFATRIKAGTHFTATGFHGRYPEAVFRDRVRKLGMGFIRTTQPFGWPPCMFIFYYLLMLLFGLHAFSLLFLPNLHISPINAFDPWQ